MNAGINIEICKKVNCKYRMGAIPGGGCVLEKCQRGIDVRVHGCPVPKNCEYKNFHVLEPVKIVPSMYCSNECKGLVKTR